MTDGVVTPFGRVSFVMLPHASRDIDGVSLVWAPAGVPAVLDTAAASMLQCFEDPTTPDDLAGDLSDVVGLDVESARKVAARTTYLLEGAGLVRRVDSEPREPWRYYYPPAAST